MRSLRNTIALTATALSLSLAYGCANSDETEDTALSAERQAYVDTVNGLRTINGLTSVNGLRTINGLRTNNGLRTINGLTTINGLRTMNGLKTMNGLSVDCLGKTLGVDCTGEPDGILSAATGMMSSDDGIATAKYMVRCALPASQGVRIKDYTGGLVTLTGELGFTPEWAEGQCDTTCQEQISACLMAFTNGTGEHIAIEMSAEDSAVGGSHTYRYQEAAFYGNVFNDNPQAYYCAGADFAGFSLVGLITLGNLEQRACSGYSNCPYKNAGACNYSGLDLLGLNSRKCNFSNSAATLCAGSGTSKTWTNPVTTYRLTK